MHTHTHTHARTHTSSRGVAWIYSAAFVTAVSICDPAVRGRAMGVMLCGFFFSSAWYTEVTIYCCTADTSFELSAWRHLPIAITAVVCGTGLHRERRAKVAGVASDPGSGSAIFTCTARDAKLAVIECALFLLVILCVAQWAASGGTGGKDLSDFAGALGSTRARRVVLLRRDANAPARHHTTGTPPRCRTTSLPRRHAAAPPYHLAATPGGDIPFFYLVLSLALVGGCGVLNARNVGKYGVQILTQRSTHRDKVDGTVGSHVGSMGGGDGAEKDTILNLHLLLGEMGGERYRLLLLVFAITIGTGQMIGNHWERVRGLFHTHGTAVVQTFDPAKVSHPSAVGRPRGSHGHVSSDPSAVGRPRGMFALLGRPNDSRH